MSTRPETEPPFVNPISGLIEEAVEHYKGRIEIPVFERDVRELSKSSYARAVGNEALATPMNRIDSYLQRNLTRHNYPFELVVEFVRHGLLEPFDFEERDIRCLLDLAAELQMRQVRDPHTTSIITNYYHESVVGIPPYETEVQAELAFLHSMQARLREQASPSSQAQRK